MAVAEKIQEKLDLFKACIRMEKTERVPNVSNVFTWKILDSEYNFTEALMNNDIMEKIVFEFHERYQFDAYLDLGTRNQAKVMKALGENTGYKIDDATGAVNFTEKTLMSGDEYDRYMQDKANFKYEMFKRKFPGICKGQVVEAIAGMLEFGQFAGEIQDKFVAIYDTPAVFNMYGVPMIPFENFFGYYRGIKEAALDLRKNKAKLKEAMDQDFETEVFPAFQAFLSQPNERYCVDAYTAVLGHSVMNNRQFGEMYWPYLKRIIDEVVARDKTIYIFCESNILRLAEYFQDIPKGHVILHPELDDIFELRRKLPNICIAGGMKTELLGSATPEVCADYARKLLDEMGEGYIFSQDKMISFKYDCRRENLLAVNDVVRNFRP